MHNWKTTSYYTLRRTYLKCPTVLLELPKTLELIEFTPPDIFINAVLCNIPDLLSNSDFPRNVDLSNNPRLSEEILDFLNKILLFLAILCRFKECI